MHANLGVLGYSLSRVLFPSFLELELLLITILFDTYVYKGQKLMARSLCMMQPSGDPYVLENVCILFRIIRTTQAIDRPHLDQR